MKRIKKKNYLKVLLLLSTLALFGLSNQNIAKASACPDYYGDFNGDGHKDEINLCSNGAFLNYSNPDGSLYLHAKWNITMEGTKLKVGDFNGDGLDDLIISTKKSYTHNWYFSKKDGTWSDRVTSMYFHHPRHPPRFYDHFIVGDYDGDGMDDFVIRSGFGSTFYYSNGDGSYRNLHSKPEWHNGIILSCTPKDINHDGFTDLIFETKSGPFNYFSNGDGTWSYTAPPCVKYKERCWYYGEAYQTCREVCASHGGYDEATRTFAGSDGAGDESLAKLKELNENCEKVLDALGIVTDGSMANGRFYGSGCFTNVSPISGTRLIRDNKERTDQDAAFYPYSRQERRICACRN